MTFTKTLGRSEYIEHLVPAIEQVEQLISSGHVVFQSAEQSLVTERVLTAFRHIQDDSGIGRIAQGMLLEAAYRSEKSGANSADLMMRFALRLVRELTKSVDGGADINRLRAELEGTLSRLRERLEHRPRTPSPTQLRQAVESAVKDHRLSEMVLEAAHLAGLDGRIFPAHTRTGQYSVELVSGYTFEAGSYPEFYDQVGKWENDNVHVLVIDGVIDRESEVHVLLGEVIDHNVPLMIVARGYSEEVIGTLAANRMRGKLKVLPIRIPFEVDVVNLITDIAIVSGADPITPMKGDTISTVRFGKLVAVERVSATARGMLTITNRKTQKSVHDHAQMLQKRRDEQHVEEMSELLNKRIRSLFSHCVHIRVGSNTEQRKLHELEAIDYGLRTIKSVLAHGVDEVTKIPNYVSHGTFEFNQSLSAWADMREVRPTMSIYSALHHGISVACTLASIECAVLADDGAIRDELENVQ